MSQANVGVSFDVTWQIAEWRQQLEAAQNDIQQLADAANNMQISIPVVMEDRLTNQVDALIAELESTRSVNIPVNMGGGGGVPYSLGDSIDEYPAEGSAAAIISGRGSGYVSEEAAEIAAAQERLFYPYEDEYEEGAAESEEVAAASTTAGSRFGGRFFGPFAALMLARHTWNEYSEYSNLNSRIDFTDSGVDADVGIAGGENVTTKQAREALKAQMDEDSGIGASLLRGAAGVEDAHPWTRYLDPWFDVTGGLYGAQQFTKDEQAKVDALRSAVMSSEQADENQKKVEREIKAENRFDKETDAISERPGIGENRFDQQRDDIAAKYSKLGDALLQDYEATRQTAEDLERFREAEQQLGQERFEAMRRVNEAENAHAELLKSQDQVESATLSGDVAGAQKAALAERVEREFQERGGASNPDAVRWRNGIGQRMLEEGDRRIEQQQSNEYADAFRSQNDLLRREEEYAAETSGDPDKAFQGRRDAYLRQAEDEAEKLREQAALAPKGSDEERRLNQRADAVENAARQHVNSMDAQHNRENQNRLGDIQSQTESNELRSQGKDQQADLKDLEQRINDSIRDAPQSQQAAMRRLGESEIDEFMHPHGSPYSGSMSGYLDRLQMDIMKQDPVAIQQAQQFKNQLEHEDAPAKTKSAAEKLEEAAERLLPAAKLLGEITLAQAAS